MQNSNKTNKLLRWEEITLTRKTIALFDFFETATYPLALLMPVVMLTSGATGSSLLPFSILMLSLTYAATLIYQELFKPYTLSNRDHHSKIFLNGAGCMLGLITTLYWALEFPLVNGLGFYFAIALSLATGFLALYVESHRNRLINLTMTKNTRSLARPSASFLTANYHPACLQPQKEENNTLPISSYAELP